MGRREEICFEFWLNLVLRFLTKILYGFFLSTMCATCPANLILLDLKSFILQCRMFCVQVIALQDFRFVSLHEVCIIMDEVTGKSLNTVRTVYLAPCYIRNCCCSEIIRSFILFKFMKILSSKDLCSLLLGNEKLPPEGLAVFRGPWPLNQLDVGLCLRPFSVRCWVYKQHKILRHR
jgi:hypothetical protein